MEKAVIIHASLSSPSAVVQEELNKELDMEFVHCYQVRDVNKDFEQLLGLHLIENKVLLVHPEEPGLRIALLTRFLMQTMRGKLTIVAVDEHWNRKDQVFDQKIMRIYKQ